MVFFIFMAEEKTILNKRIINDNIYKLLEDSFINEFEQKIVRHHKIIRKRNYELNGLNILSQKVEEYDNVFCPDPDDATNVFMDNALDFGQFHKFTTEISDIIDNSKIETYNQFKVNILNKEFTYAEKQELEQKISAYLNNNYDHIYIRLGIKPTDKNFYILKLFELYMTTYFNEMTADNQNKLLDSIDILPMFNDTILYANKKYDYVNERHKYIKQQEHDIQEDEI